jgi:anti-sigma factor ChrR (cupin superfamily)
MNCDERQQESAMHALGALTPDQVAALEQRLQHDPGLQAKIARFRAVATAFAASVVPRHEPSPEVRGRILERIRRTPQMAPPVRSPNPEPASAAPDSQRPPPTGFSFVTGDDGWVKTQVSGLEFRVLSINPKEGYRVMLGRLAPGTRLPHHVHSRGAEGLFVVSGDLYTSGRLLQAGDYVHAESGTDHPEVYSPNGCIALLVEPVDGPEVVLSAEPGVP